MKIVLASGVLDTSVPQVLQEMHNAELVALTATWRRKDLDVIRERALNVGAVASYTLDLRESSRTSMYCRASRPMMYEGVYPLYRPSRPYREEAGGGAARKARA